MASSVTLRAAASTPPSSSEVVYEPAGRSAARAAIVAHSVSSQAKPCGVALGRRSVGVEAAAGVSMAGRPDGIDPDEQRVAVAVDRPVDEPQDVARCVSPLRHRRPRDREWKWTSPVAVVAATASASM